ncbi:hypothetical protein ACFQZZ_11165 [Nocardia sp. GCM10030253]|uniref:hypothetical protein n=1 Tax=Nocardia sp. GCM10030253 TaxID=3273404 RepID=UPI003633923B
MDASTFHPAVTDRRMIGRTVGGTGMSTPNTNPSEHISVGQWIARAIAIVVLIPVRVLWESVKLVGRIALAVLHFIWTQLLDPVCRIAWHWVIRPAWAFAKDFLWGWLLQHVLWGMVLTPIGALLLDFLLRPLRRAVEEFLWRRVLRPAAVWLTKQVLLPIASAVLWVLYTVSKYVIAWPLYQLWRWILLPLWRLLRAVLIYAWRIVTIIVGVLIVIPCRAIHRTVLRPIFTALAIAWQATVTRPARWFYTNIVTPMNKWATEIMTSVFRG